MVNGISIINEFETFRLLDNFASCKLAKPKEKYHCSGISQWVQRIEFFDEAANQFVKMDLYGRKEATKVYGINETEFGTFYFEELSLKFRLKFMTQLEKHAVIGIESNIASIAFKRSQDGNVYISIFYLESGDSRYLPILFIEGVWKTTLPDYIISKLPSIT